MNCRRGRLSAFGILLFLFSSPVRPQDFEPHRNTLVGLRGFLVVINDLGPEATALGLQEQVLVDLVESALRNQGIRVLSREEYLESKDRNVALLSITLSSVRSRAGDTLALSCLLQVTQTVTLVRDPSIRVPAGTWSVGGTGIIASASLVPEVKKTLMGHVEQFLAAYRSVNSKK